MHVFGLWKEVSKYRNYDVKTQQHLSTLQYKNKRTLNIQVKYMTKNVF